MSSVTIQINGDSSEFDAAAKDVIDGFKAIAKQADKTSKEGSTGFETFKGVLGAAGVVGAINLAKSALTSLTATVGESVRLSNIQTDAINSLNQALINTGEYSAETSKDIQNFASELQATSRVGDEVILKNAALIQSLAELDKEGLKRTTRAALELSQGLGIGFEEASKKLARASKGQVDALKEVGIVVEKTGDNAKDFENALAAVESRFSGSAASKIKEYEGVSDQLGNTIGDVKEVFGDIVTQNPAVVSALGEANTGFQELGKFIKDNRDTLIQLINAGLIPFVEVGGSVVRVSIEIANGFLKIKDAIQDAAAEDTLEGLKTQLEEVRELNKDLVDVNTGERIKSTAETFLEAQIETLNKAREEDQKYIDDRNALFDGLVESTQGVQDRIVEALRNSYASQSELDEQENERMEARANAAVERKRLENEAKLEVEREFNQAFRDELADTLGKTVALEEEAAIQRLIGEGKYLEAKRKLIAANEKIERESIFTIRKFEDKTQKEKLSDLKSTLSTVSSLTASSSSELFAIGKAAALATATIDGIAAVQKALGSAPPPFNFALAAAVGAAQAVNLSKIASAKPPTGAFDGALVTSGSSMKDTEPFMLSKGEIVAPAKSFDEVVEGVAKERGFRKDGESAPNGQAQTIIFQGDILADDFYINALIDRIRDQVQFRNADLGVNGVTA